MLSPPATAAPWPGSASITTVDPVGVLGVDVSGLDYEGSGSATPGVLWAVDNGSFLMHRLVWDGIQWVRDTTNGWSTGKALRYPSGTGLPDAEGVTLTDAGAAGGVYVSSERDAANSSVGRISVLRYDISGIGTTLTATQEWNLTPDLPPVGANAGAESVEWVPDSYLVESGFVDQNTEAPYDPATYFDHGTGLFFVGLEGNGLVYAYALDQTSSSFTRVASFASGFSTFAALHWEPETEQLWVVCDNNCLGASRVFEVDPPAGPTPGRFVAVADYDRPAGMPNLNNEGFTITPDAECVDGSKLVFWADDGNADGHALRAGTIACEDPPRADFNGDGFADLAVGVPDEDVGTAAAAGAVNVLYGSASGLTGASSQLWHQNTGSVIDSAEAGDHFGAAVAAGDFNDDGFADLAVGAPDEDMGAFGDAGVVHVLYGSASGLTATGSQLWSQNATAVADAAETGDRFGGSLASGTFDDDAFAELVVGAPGEDAASTNGVGVVHVIPGSAAGLTGSGSQLWGQDSTGIVDSAEAGDGFGSAVAMGDFNADGRDDLAAGVPGENVGAVVDGGAVHVLPGSATGLTATGSGYWTQNSSAIADSTETGDRFGSSLASSAFNGDAFAELVVGVADEDAASANAVGVVHVIPGSAAGLTGTGSQLWGQDSSGIVDSAEADDGFGRAVATGDFNADGRDDLAIGVPDEDVGAVVDGGAVHVLPGSATGLTATGSGYWTQNTTGIADSTETGDRFGGALACGKLNSGAHAELIVGAPDESAGATAGVGVLHVIPGSAGGLTATGSQLWGQDSSEIADSAEAGDGFGAALGA